ncbi:MAG: D-alanyl-D-alanine carboxypeptidase [Candidatus Magasanikbacteria bacterium]|nr:D-alanyl-D-alanine carboxypeptidase [Candidatus Magasanikbacteria bacterium]
MPLQVLFLATIIFLSFFIAHPRERDFASLPESKAPNLANVSALSPSSLAPADLPGSDFRCSGIDPARLSLMGGRAAFAEYLDNNSVIFEKNTEKRWPIASLTKLMTAVVASEKMSSDTEITITENAVATEGIAGGFKAGEKFLLRDLIKAMLVSSSNDASYAIAESFGEKNFIDAMQAKATELLMLDTTFVEPAGLSPLNQSTASDLVKLVKYIREQEPELLAISRRKEAAIVELGAEKARRLLNVDRFAGEDDFLGGKTGYTDEAERNLIAIFDIRGKEVLTVVLGSQSALDETKTIKNFIDSCATNNLTTN